MADEFLRSKLYEYGANSNLVLEAERDSRSRADEGKGEVETLRGKIDKVRMGERVGNSGERVELQDKIEKARSKRLRNDSGEEQLSKHHKSSNVFLASKGSNVLSQSEGLDSSRYRPKTRETKDAYEELLRIVQGIVGDQPADILKGAADEILGILKRDSLRPAETEKELKAVTSGMSADVIHSVVGISKRITDYFVDEEEKNEESAPADEEMAVVFDDDDDENDAGNILNAEEDDSEDEREGVDADARGQLKGEEDKAEMFDMDDKYKIEIHEIDAHWLQRQISKFYSDANVSSKLAIDVLKSLSIEDERVCENKLVVLLDFDKFELIKLLMKNRAMIYHCTRLRQAQSDEEIKSVEESIVNDRSCDGPALLQLFRYKASAENWAQDRIGVFADKAKREAKALNKDKRADQLEFDGVETADVVESGEVAVHRDIFSAKPIDLDVVQFAEGGHLMTNKRCELPDKSWRAQKKGYEEVHVPALRPIIPPSERLVEISELPDWTQPAFKGVRSLNRVQSKMVDAALHGDENLLLCAPTGAGKTNVALMCMLNQLAAHRTSKGDINFDAFKIVYIAPMKALVQEVVLTFTARLAPFGIQVRELSGDQNLTSQQMKETQLIVTTPEKWDIITRKSGDRLYTQLVKLMIIDEIHLLHDDRGPVLEGLVARSIRHMETSQDKVRLVGLSATLPNYHDVASFLRVEKSGLFFFDNSYRPVPLQQQYIGITEKKALKRFQLMNEICYEKALQHAGRNQVLIFTHSRAETAKTAKALRDMATDNDTLNQFLREDSASVEILREEAATAKNGDLKELLPFGFAIHHAGMTRSDRTLVEDLFADKHVQVLVSTATLAWGVNLPCHTVILKGTQIYNPEQGRWVELSPLDVMQMLGRAGRYGLDSEGEGIIITAHSELQYYLSLMNQQLPIESQLVKKLPDMLNAEIVMGSVSSVMEAAEWLGYTYLYVRMLRNPSTYGISPSDIEQDPNLLRRRLELVHASLVLLDKHALIKYDRKTGNFRSAVMGRICSHYYVSYGSMSTFNSNLKSSMSDIEIFRLFSFAGEFSQIHVREEEKLELSKLVSRVPIPIKESVEEASAKVNVLLQAYISRLKLEGFALVADMAFIQQSACRLMRAIFEVALRRGWAALSNKLLTVCKMVERRIWVSQSPLRQFTSIPEVILRKLEKNSDISWERYFDLKPPDLGEMVKIPKMGKTLHKFVHMFPKLLLSAHVLPITRSMLKIDLTVTSDFEYDSSIHGSMMMFWIIVEDVDGEHILHHEPLFLNATIASNDILVNFTVPILEPAPPQYFIKIVSDRWLHSEAVLPVSFRHLLLPQKFPPPTELLDLQPLPVGAFRNDLFEGLFKHFKMFNPIQTQTFSTLFQTDVNALICAPTGSGKTACGEFALLRAFSADIGAKCVYVAPKMEIAQAVYKDWKARFAPALGINVVLLTGEASTDLNFLNAGNIIISTVAHWDMISRRWKQRRAIQSIALYIFDEMHLLGGDGGPAYEIVVSRARFISSQLEKEIRIVCLASSLANASDVGEWIGASAQSIYNFSPDVRPVPLDLQLLSFETTNFSGRILSMAKPAYKAIVKQMQQKPVVVFVPSRKQAQLTAVDLVSFATASGVPDQFGGLDVDAAAGHIHSDQTLIQMIGQGVAYLHSGLHKSEVGFVQHMFASGKIQVLVVPQNMCWSLWVSAFGVIVMDTVFYDGKEHRYVDYPINDLLRMVGVASRQGIDSSSKCFVMHYAPKGQYLRKLLHEPLPIESHLDHFLHDHLNAEIVSKTIENKSDAVDYLTWSYYYRRLTQNPNYYSLQGTSHRHLSDHLSELVESTIVDLEESRCVAVEDDVELSPLNLGMIAGYYYIEYTTVELFASSVTAKMKIKGIVEIISAASEFSSIALRLDEDSELKRLSQHQVFQLSELTKWDDPATKVLILLQAHFSRTPLSLELASDLVTILTDAVKLLQAVVDVISSQGWLRPALAAMEVCQMIVQGLWEKDSSLMQIPHFSTDLIEQLAVASPPVENVFDVIDMEDDARSKYLCFSQVQMSDIALFCNAYPNIEVQYELNIEGDVPVGESIQMKVSLTREHDEVDSDDESALGLVIAPRYPMVKREGWWLVIGHQGTNGLLSIKRVSLAHQAQVKLEFTAPESPGDYNLVLYVICDSYMGCDQEYEFNVNVVSD